MTADDDRLAAEARWLALTRAHLPGAAAARGWPVRADHCFGRILLDNACGGVWYEVIAGRPAYAHADRALLDRAIALAEATLAGRADLAELNRRSLAWRKQARSRQVSATAADPDRGTPGNAPSLFTVDEDRVR